MLVLSIPSPSSNSFSLGPVTIHYYALCIIAGILFAMWLGGKRWRARGGSQEDLDLAVLWAIIAGIVGARAYHVLTDAQLYFAEGEIWYRCFYIWEGGLGIWGGVALGALAVAIVCRRRKVAFWAMADSLAPAVIIAQGIGRLGNWFNQELFGAPTDLPWGLEIDILHRPSGYLQNSTFHPAFLYEMIWDIFAGLLLLGLDKKLKLGYGKVFWSYVALYTLGRLPIEHIKIDTVNKFLGLRVNEYTSIILLLLALIILVILHRKCSGRELQVSFAAPLISPGEADSDLGEVEVELADSKAEKFVVKKVVRDMESISANPDVLAGEPEDKSGK